MAEEIKNKEKWFSDLYVGHNFTLYNTWKCSIYCTYEINENGQ